MISKVISWISLTMSVVAITWIFLQQIQKSNIGKYAVAKGEEFMGCIVLDTETGQVIYRNFGRIIDFGTTDNPKRTMLWERESDGTRLGGWKRFQEKIQPAKDTTGRDENRLSEIKLAALHNQLELLNAALDMNLIQIQSLYKEKPWYFNPIANPTKTDIEADLDKISQEIDKKIKRAVKKVHSEKSTSQPTTSPFDKYETVKYPE